MEGVGALLPNTTPGPIRDGFSSYLARLASRGMRGHALAFYGPAKGFCISSANGFMSAGTGKVRRRSVVGMSGEQEM